MNVNELELAHHHEGCCGKPKTNVSPEVYAMIAPGGGSLGPGEGGAWPAQGEPWGCGDGSAPPSSGFSEALLWSRDAPGR